MDSATHLLRTGRRGALFQLQMAFRDLANSSQRLGLAWSLAWHDVGSRYRGSILGPFWITLSMGLMVLGIGFVNATLFGVPLKGFLPIVALGIVFFGTISGTVNEGCETFVQAANILSQTSLPMLTFVWRTVLRNLIYLMHHLAIVILVISFFADWTQVRPAPALLGLALLIANASWLSLIVGIASSRFRDIPQIVTSVLQFTMFITPVFWPPERMAKHPWVLDYNPFYYLLEAIRAPLLGQNVAAHVYGVLVLLALGGWVFAFGLFARTRRRIVHYL